MEKPKRTQYFSRLPMWLSGKEFAFQHGSCRMHRFDPWVRKMPWRRKWQPTPVFLSTENSMDREAWRGDSSWGHKESDKTEQLNMHACTQYFPFIHICSCVLIYKIFLHVLSCTIFICKHSHAQLDMQTYTYVSTPCTSHASTLRHTCMHAYMSYAGKCTCRYRFCVQSQI